MRRAHVFLFAVLALAAAACGAPQAGDACDKNGFLCADATAAMECKASAGGGAMWMKLPCRGPGGCKRTSDVITCDMTMNTAGDACASTAEGKGLCNSTATATLECRTGTLVQTNTCRTCSVSGEQVICQP